MLALTDSYVLVKLLCSKVLENKQLRVHGTIQSRFYLHVTSRAIIEDCRQVSFAPYNLTYPELEEYFKVLILLIILCWGKNQLCSVLLRNVSRHVGSVWLGHGLWTYQRFWATSFPTSKKNLYSRLVGLTCLKYAGENTGFVEGVTSLSCTCN